jgi:Tfp pilus assembly protein PilF
MLVRGSHLAEAAPLLQQLVQSLPEDVRVWQLQAQFAQAVGRPEAAADARDAAERAQSLLGIHNLPSGLVNLSADIGMAREFNQALQQQRAGNVIGAAQRMTQLARDETHWQNSNPWLLQTVAAVHLEAGDPATARRLLDRQITHECFPTARAWNLLGYVESLELHPEQAWSDWRRSLFMNPAAVDLEKMNGLADKSGDHEAARLYEGLAHQYAGITALRSDNRGRARMNLQQAVSINPDLPEAWYYLGETERMLGNQSAAEEAYRRCRSLKPQHGRARARLERLARHAHGTSTEKE